MKRSLGRYNNGQLNLFQRLVEALEDRENLLLETPTMMLAMYLDPRIKNRLSSIQQECAKIAAERLYARLKTMNNQNSRNVSTNDTLDELNEEASNYNNSIADNNISLTTNILSSEFRGAIIKYDAVRPTNIKSNIFDFLKEKKGEFPVMYKLASIVHAVYAGQCVVERNFSAFSCVRSSRKARLLPKNISNILMI